MNTNKRIARCLIGERYTEEIAELESLGIEVIPLPKNALLDDEISNHADILSFRLDDDLLLIDSAIAGEIAPLIKDYSVFPVNGITSPYPKDVRLNAAVIGKKIICNPSFAHDAILQTAYNEYELISTNQGYTKCNICIVNENAIITEDPGITALLKNYQMDVLKLTPGFVQLSDSHYGFIGGASAKISENEIYFSGDLSEHPEYEQILAFLNKHNCKAIFSKNRKLTDFGGIIAI